LSRNEQRVVNLIACRLFPADIARKMQVSAPYVNQIITGLRSKGLIQRTNPVARTDGKREYHHFYELSQQIKSLAQKEEQYTACRVHNLRKKISLLSQSKPLALDKRAGYQKSWTMRGGERHKFWYPGKAGQPSVTIDWHIKSLIVYVDKKQNIVARTPAEAMEIGWRAIYAAVDSFVEQQSRFGIQIEVPHVGETVGKPHGGFVGSDSPVMEEGVTKEHWWIDRSQEAELGPGHPELETDKPENMTRLDNLIKVSEQVDLTHLPEMFQGMIDPLNNKMLQLVSQLQGGRPVETMFRNALDLMMRMMEKMDKMDDELKALKENR
jgi:DNA-binding MarR family transcriptional regulator